VFPHQGPVGVLRPDGAAALADIDALSPYSKSAGEQEKRYGCAYCIVMHTNDARKHGESDEWMHLLDAWREAPIYSARERAALD
jgi:hypothetical protein